jgi:hypothetical protein
MTDAVEIDAPGRRAPLPPCDLAIGAVEQDLELDQEKGPDDRQDAVERQERCGGHTRGHEQPRHPVRRQTQAKE